MLNFVKECAPWLNWKTAGIAALVTVGLVLCTGMPALGVLAGIAPVLLIIACLVPCLAPLLLLRRKKEGTVPQGIIPLAMQSGHASSTCSCGQASCSVGANSYQNEQQKA